MAAASHLPAGKSVLVTGAARGLGAAIARASVEHGAAVVVLADILADALTETVDSLGPTAHGVELDVTDPERGGISPTTCAATTGAPTCS